MNATDQQPMSTSALHKQVIQKHLETMNVGDVVSYAELEALVKVDLEELRPAFHRAAAAMLKEKGWLFGCVRKYGYKRLDASEKLDVIAAKRKHIARTARKAGAIAASIDVDQLDDDTKARHHSETTMASVIALATSRKAVNRIEERTRHGQLPSTEILTLFSK